jgi:GntR family transcriptional repressor for pyruvate dehydrogenase complex
MMSDGSTEVFKRVAQPRAYEDIVRQIQQSISDGIFGVGDQLPGERELAAQFRVSRVVIREAMRTLEAKGVLEVRHGSGTFVVRIPSRFLSQSLTLLLELEEAPLLELYEVRQVLEVLSVRQAAQYSTSKDVEVLQRSMQQMSDLFENGLHSKDEFVAVSSKDVHFHCAIAKISRNAPLEALVGAILPLVTAGRTELIDRQTDWGLAIERIGYARAVKHHSRIVEAVSSGDPDAAERAMRDHLERSMETYRNWR